MLVWEEHIISFHFELLVHCESMPACLYNIFISVSYLFVLWWHSSDDVNQAWLGGQAVFTSHFTFHSENILVHQLVTSCRYTSGDVIWDKTLIGTVSGKAIFCFDSMMLLLNMVL